MRITTPCIEIYSINDAAIYNEFPNFNINASDEPTTTTSSSKTPMTTESATIFPTRSSTGFTGMSAQSASRATSISRGVDSAATPIFAPPFAFVGAATTGMLAF